MDAVVFEYIGALVKTVPPSPCLIVIYHFSGYHTYVIYTVQLISKFTHSCAVFTCFFLIDYSKFTCGMQVIESPYRVTEYKSGFS